MIPYASVTSGQRNLDALRERGWRLLLSPPTLAANGQSAKGFRYALDNGAWSYHQANVPFNEVAFVSMLRDFGDGADWLAVPDIVAGGIASLELSLQWIPHLHGICPLLLPVQDGMTPAQIEPMVGPELGLFLGGSTPWKLATMRAWGELAARTGAHFHVARVNSVRRIAQAADAGAHSIDGTSATRYSVTVRRLDQATKQLEKR